ncbi:18449_t:CDS:2 [Rhizophagus irregularis]|nr:18449_t:CDS:2 [Rhizophagus irregularis]
MAELGSYRANSKPSFKFVSELERAALKLGSNDPSSIDCEPRLASWLELARLVRSTT